LIPTSQRATACDSHANRKAEPRFPKPAWRINHAEALLRENGTEQHPPCWNFKSKKLFDADWLKRDDSVTVIGNAAADTDLGPNEAAGNAHGFRLLRNGLDVFQWFIEQNDAWRP
jgi:hypothetical protein